VQDFATRLAAETYVAELRLYVPGDELIVEITLLDVPSRPPKADQPLLPGPWPRQWPS
jgi:hypothetical protein